MTTHVYWLCHRGENSPPMPEVWTNIVAEGEADFVRRKIVG